MKESLNVHTILIGSAFTLVNLAFMFFGFGRGYEQDSKANALDKQAFQFEMEKLGDRFDRFASAQLAQQAMDSAVHSQMNIRLTGVEKGQAKSDGLFAVIIENFKLKRPANIHRSDWPSLTKEGE